MGNGRSKFGDARWAWKSEEYMGLKPTVYDWCRMAAFIDGEGNVNISARLSAHNKDAMQTRLIIGNTNPALALWLKENFGGNVAFRDVQRRNPRAKQVYVWSCTASRAAWILHNSIPWMLLKAAHGKIVIEMQECLNISGRTGGKAVPEEVMTHRRELKIELNKLNVRGCSSQETNS